MAVAFDIETFIEENYESLLKLTVKISKDSRIAEDILHYTAVALLKRKALLYGIEDPEAFISVCIRRVTINYFKREAKYKDDQPLENHLYAIDSGSIRSYNYSEWVMFLDKALASFPTKFRNAFRAHYMDNAAIEDLAPALGITPNALSKRFATMRRTIARKNPSLLRQIEILALL